MKDRVLEREEKKFHPLVHASDSFSRSLTRNQLKNGIGGTWKECYCSTWMVHSHQNISLKCWFLNSWIPCQWFWGKAFRKRSILTFSTQKTFPLFLVLILHIYFSLSGFVFPEKKHSKFSASWQSLIPSFFSHLSLRPLFSWISMPISYFYLCFSKLTPCVIICTLLKSKLSSPRTWPHWDTPI